MKKTRTLSEGQMDAATSLAGRRARGGEAWLGPCSQPASPIAGACYLRLHANRALEKAQFPVAFDKRILGCLRGAGEDTEQVRAAGNRRSVLAVPV